MVSQCAYLSELAGAGAGDGGGAAAGVLVAGEGAPSDFPDVAGTLSADLVSPPGAGALVLSATFLSSDFCPVLPFRKSVTYQPVPLSAKPAAEIFL